MPPILSPQDFTRNRQAAFDEWAVWCGLLRRFRNFDVARVFGPKGREGGG